MLSPVCTVLLFTSPCVIMCEYLIMYSVFLSFSLSLFFLFSLVLLYALCVYVKQAIDVN